MDVRVGIASAVSTAATASGRQGGGGVLVVAPECERQWLAQLPVEALCGVGPRQAGVLRKFGVHDVGVLAGLSVETVQRVLGAREGRTAWERARGIDPRPVTPRALAASASVRHRFRRDELDGAPVRAALLDLVVRLGTLLRGRGQAAQGVTLTLEFAGGPSWSRTQRLAQTSAHEEDLRAAAYRCMDAAALQRARLTGMILRAEDLVGADRAPEQGTLDGAREARLRVEEVVDEARARFGPQVMVGPATLLGRVS
ncbi:hypothetical protein ABZ896_42725 [Streptomyces sp. NPDC047072]|uniref:DNA polymerase Y family protein n=1 Tax=Streptomyces sp. NPDC047072 TaxID=3154809 RepID=UPI00340405DD